MNNDGIKEIYFVGNDNAHEVFTGPKNSFQGAVVSFGKDFKFNIIPKKISGFNIPFYGRSIEFIEINKEKSLLVTQNNNKTLHFVKK
jgi:hypothetical protein